MIMNFPEWDAEAVDPVKWLNRYGYLNELPPADRSKLDVLSAEFPHFIELMQDFTGPDGAPGALLSDGVFGPKTRDKMNEPRCGFPDFLEARGEGVPEAARWPESCRDITFAHRINGIGRLSKAEVDAVFRQVCNDNNAVCGVRMELIEDFSRSRIYANSGTLGGNTLAWSYLPNGRCDFRAEQKYNTGVNWDAQFLRAVGNHEVGHALNLGHSSNPRDNMYAFANRDLYVPQPGDIARLVGLYGEPFDQPQPEPPTPEPPGDYIDTFEIDGKRYGIVPVTSGGGPTFPEW